MSKNKFLPYFAALCVWMFFAHFQIGFDSPDEHYPTLDAAGGILFGFWNQTWEWKQGLRSWLQPIFLSTILLPFKHLGITDRLILDSIARSSYAFLSLLSVWAIGQLSEQRFSRTAQLLFIFAWPLVTWGTRHGSDTFAIPIMLSGFALVFIRASIRSAVIGAILLALAFCLRYTLAIPIFFGLLFSFKRIGAKNIAIITSSALLTCALLFSVDFLIYFNKTGQGFVPAWQFFKFNVLQGAGWFHASPWYELILYLLVLWVPFPGWLFIVLRKPWKNIRTIPWALSVTIASIITFSFIRHKELRFIFPILPFALLASIPYLTRFWLKFAIVANAIMLLAVLILYSEPHGALVKSLNQATNAANPNEHFLVAADLGIAIPKFYMQKPLTIIEISKHAWTSVCEGTWPEDPLNVAKTENTLLIISKTRCEKSNCTLIGQVKKSLGYYLRQKVSQTVQPEFIYRCNRI